VTLETSTRGMTITPSGCLLASFSIFAIACCSIAFSAAAIFVASAGGSFGGKRGGAVGRFVGRKRSAYTRRYSLPSRSLPLTATRNGCDVPSRTRRTHRDPKNCQTSTCAAIESRGQLHPPTQILRWRPPPARRVRPSRGIERQRLAVHPVG